MSKTALPVWEPINDQSLTAEQFERSLLLDGTTLDLVFGADGNPGKEGMHLAHSSLHMRVNCGEWHIVDGAMRNRHDAKKWFDLCKRKADIDAVLDLCNQAPYPYLVTT